MKAASPSRATAQSAWRGNGRGGRGKIDNCQVAVFGVLTDGQRHAPVDMRLYLPKRWIEDAARCDKAGVPPAARVLTSKSQHALDIVRCLRLACACSVLRVASTASGGLRRMMRRTGIVTPLRTRACTSTSCGT
jgi:SRSO17 transposase